MNFFVVYTGTPVYKNRIARGAVWTGGGGSSQLSYLLFFFIADHSPPSPPQFVPCIFIAKTSALSYLVTSRRTKPIQVLPAVDPRLDTATGDYQ